VFDDHGFAEAVHFIGDKSMTNWIPTTVNAVLSLVFLFWAFLCTPATADDREKLLGNWKLVTFYTEDIRTPGPLPRCTM
jgi:hypothetical protein